MCFSKILILARDYTGVLPKVLIFILAVLEQSAFHVNSIAYIDLWHWRLITVFTNEQIHSCSCRFIAIK
jgi:hypothetical protein